MNINQSINRILYSLKEKGQIYQLNSFQFYNEKNEMYSTKYQILKKELVEVYNIKTNKTEKIEKYNLKEEYYKKINVLKYFLKEYEGMGQYGEEINRKRKERNNCILY